MNTARHRKGLAKGRDGVLRCFWSTSHDDYAAYHDTEWGRPVGDDRLLFEKLTLEGFQAGLSWLTILRKREHFREAFDGFDTEKIARYKEKDVRRLLQDAGIVRHEGKIRSVINNAKRALELQKEFGSLSAFLWQFEPDDKELPRELNFEILTGLAKTEHSKALSRALKRRGWTYVGPTTVYAFMQAVGMVNDHLSGCSVRGAVEKERRMFKRPTP